MLPKFLFILILGTTLAWSRLNDVRILTDNTPDLTSLTDFEQSVGGEWQTPEQRAMATWKWILALRHQLPQASENGSPVIDPIKNFNSYGAMICGNTSLNLTRMWKDMGFSGYQRIVFPGHVVAQAQWDGNYHMFDAAFGFYYKSLLTGNIVSLEDIFADTPMVNIMCPVTTSAGKLGYSLYEPDRMNSGEMKEFADFNPAHDIETTVAPSSQIYTINLRPGESYKRSWSSMGSTTDYYIDYGSGDPNTSNALVRSNGEWIFEPDLSASTYEETIDQDSNMISDVSPKLHPEITGKSFAVFSVEAANVITSAILTIKGYRATASDSVRVLLSTDEGSTYTSIWEQSATGLDSTVIPLKSRLGICYSYKIKVELSTGSTANGAGINSLKLRTLTQIGQRSLPKLTLGNNRVMLRLGTQPQKAHFRPVAVTYSWTEFRGSTTVDRSHTEIVTDSGGSHEYYINVGGWRDPAMKSLTVNFTSYSPLGASNIPGYSDNTDVGPGPERSRYYFTYGVRNLALNKTYKSTPAPTNDGTNKKLTNGATTPLLDANRTAVGAKWAANANPAIVLDLDSIKTVGGVRILEAADATCDYTDSIEILTSADSSQFISQGKVRSSDVWFAPTNYPWPSKWDLSTYRSLKCWGITLFRFDWAFDSPVRARYILFRLNNSSQASIQEIEVQDSTMTKMTVTNELNNGFTIPSIAIETPDKSLSQLPSLAALSLSPNPFETGIARVRLNLRKPANLQLQIVDIRGRKIVGVADGFRQAGLHTWTWNGKNTKNQNIAPGIYLLRATLGTQTLTHRFAVLR